MRGMGQLPLRTTGRRSFRMARGMFSGRPPPGNIGDTVHGSLFDQPHDDIGVDGSWRQRTSPTVPSSSST